MATETPDAETQLLTFCKSILKYQIIPMDFMNLRDLVPEECKNKQLRKFVDEKYPDTQFLEFLKKYPGIFTLNPNRSVILAEGNSFTLPYADTPKNSSKTVDEVDGCDRSEYISDTDSDESDGAENDGLIKKDERQKIAEMWSTSSSESESSVDVFSSELVHTSDSNQSSLTSTSASEN